MKININLPSILSIVFFSLFVANSAVGQNLRSFDGSLNNQLHPTWGAVGSSQQWISSNGYSDSISMPGGMNRMNPRSISNMVMDQSGFLPSKVGLSDYWWTFGQFIDHDITLVKDDTSEFFPVMIPMGDPVFDTLSTGSQMIPMFRSHYDPFSGSSPNNPRAHINSASTWIDASVVYGSDSIRAAWLRTGTDGKLKTSAGNLLPFNTVTGEYADPVDLLAPQMGNENPNIQKFFVAGDVRANEQPTLICLHTLFVREHNRLCDSIINASPFLSDEQTYQLARKLVGALIQHIVYDEWLPSAGISLGPYPGYDPTVEPSIANVFSAAAFRLGHTLVNEQLIRIDEFGDTLVFGHVNLKDGFFNPEKVYAEGGITPFLQGMATQVQQDFDLKIVGALRNFLFASAGHFPGLDLAAININRGRERGLSPFNQIRRDLGLSPCLNFSDLNSDTIIAQDLDSVYSGDIENVDPWVGMLSEEHIPGGAFGEVVSELLQWQFERLRDGDRFYYLNDPDLTVQNINMINSTSFSDLIKRNSGIFSIQDSVFFAKPYQSISSVSSILTDKLEVNAYPNPFHDYLNIDIFTMEGTYTAEIYDKQGRLVESVELIGKNNLIFLSELSSGIYFYRVTDIISGNAATGKLIKGN